MSKPLSVVLCAVAAGGRCSIRGGAAAAEPLGPAGTIDAHLQLRDLAGARAALAAGVTTARSLGVDHFADIGIRELHRAGASDVPDALAAGYRRSTSIRVVVNGSA